MSSGTLNLAQPDCCRFWDQRRSQEFDLGGYKWVKETKQPYKKFKVDWFWEGGIYTDIPPPVATPLSESVCWVGVGLLLQSSHAVYQFLSGAAITPNTRFLSLKHHDTRHDYHSLVVFASYVVTAHDCRQRILSSVPQSQSSCACRKRWVVLANHYCSKRWFYTSFFILSFFYITPTCLQIYFFQIVDNHDIAFVCFTHYRLAVFAVCFIAATPLCQGKRVYGILDISLANLNIFS